MCVSVVMEVGLAQLLRAAWISGTLPIIIASIPTSKLRWFRETLLCFARRGKIRQASSQVRHDHLLSVADEFSFAEIF